MKKKYSPWRKRLAIAVTGAVLSGIWGGMALAADHDVTITGDKATDSANGYTEFDELASPYQLKFADGTTIAVSDKGIAAIKSVDKAYNSYAVISNGVLNLAATGSELGTDTYGVRHHMSDDSILQVGASNTNISVSSKGMAYGASVVLNNGLYSYASINFLNSALNAAVYNTNVNISAQGEQGAVGVYANGSGSLISAVNVYGNLNMKSTEDLQWGVDGKDSAKTKGIYAKSNGATSAVHVYGDTNLVVNGTAIMAEGKDASVELDKGALITVNKDDANSNYALAVDGGKISINNKNKSDYWDNTQFTSVIKGNVAALNNGGTINLQLVNDKSTWEGVAVNSGSGNINIKLGNGAIWTNDSYGTVGDGFTGSSITNLTSDTTAGEIFQKDAHVLTINNLDGKAIVVYEHTGDGSEASHYQAGNTVINKAAAGSAITISTDNTGIDVNDGALVDKVLNALAGKLTYTDFAEGAANLVAKAQIASGLTTSSMLKEGTITFDSEGKGTFVVKQTQTDFSNAITGDAEKDNIYSTSGVFENGVYNLQKETTITMTDGAAAISVENPVKIVSEEQALHLSTSGEDVVRAISQTSGNEAQINVKQLDISAKSSNGIAEGVYVFSNDSEARAKLDINGDVNIAVAGVPTSGHGSIGLHTSGNAELNVVGDVTVTDASKVRYGYYNKSGIYAGAGTRQFHEASTINIKGNVDLDGFGVYANGFGSTVNIDGGAEISTEGIAVSAQSGVININVDAEGSANAENNVSIRGNVGAVSGLTQQGETFKDTVVNLGLNNSSSSLDGIVYTSAVEGFTSKVNMVLANGATWTNEQIGSLPSSWTNASSSVAKLTGGEAGKVGVIKQLHQGDLQIDEYSGSTLVIYGHSNDGTEASNYSAGAVKINKAQEGATITLSTDNQGIEVNDGSQVAKVLNALASKLFYLDYINGETSLNGMVQIASGLTSSSQTLRLKEITFDSATGQGSYVKSSEPVVANQPLIEDNYTGNTQRQYWDDAYIRTTSGGLTSYIFDSDAEITYYTSGGLAGQQQALGLGVISWAGNNDGLIDMNGHKLTLVGDGHNSLSNRERPSGIKVASQKLDINNANGVDILIKNGQYVDGAIHVIGMPSEGAWYNGNGNAVLNINNDDDPEHAVKIRFENSQGTKAAVAVDKNSGTATLNIKGLLDVEADGFTAVKEYYGNVYIGGGSIISNGYALEARGGSMLVNGELKEDGFVAATSGNRDVTIKGDIHNTIAGSVGVALNTAASSLEGGIYTDADSRTTLQVANGALWTNTLHSGEDWTGSTVYALSGGKNAGSAGIIFQKDAKDLQIDNYSGNTVLVYEHDQDGNFAAGATHIQHAAEGSAIVLSTDNTGLDLEDSDAVVKVLNNLAGKLFYTGYVGEAENNLAGTVQIASGLTTSMQQLKFGNIAYDSTTGQGSYSPVTSMEGAQISGNPQFDQFYVHKGILSYDEEAKMGTYNFAEGTVVNIEGGFAGIDTVNAATINLAEGQLNITSQANMGVKHQYGGELNINAKEVKVEVNGSSTTYGVMSDGSSSINMTGDLKVSAANAAGKQVYGIYAGTGSSISVGGDLTMNNNGAWGLTNGDKGGSFMFTDNYAAGLYANGGTISVDGEVDLLTNGNGVLSYGTNQGNANVNIGGGSITVNKESSVGYYSLLAYQGGKINFNYDETNAVAGTSDVTLNGNIGVILEDPYASKNATVNLGLNTKDSVWTGVLHNNCTDGKDQANIYLANGATWNNEQYGKIFVPSFSSDSYSGSIVTNLVGATEAKDAGYIYQKDGKNLTIKNYSGFTNIYYHHEGDGTTTEQYTAGDTYINKAKAGAGITLMTNNSGITLSDKEQVNAVLNALAGKLYYTGYGEAPENLQGTVAIASGLTTASISKSGSITFNEENGQGSYVPPAAPDIPEHQEVFEFTAPITGDSVLDEAYLYGGVLKDAGYIFEADSLIKIGGSQGAAAIDVQKDVNIDAKNSTLQLVVNKDNGNAMGIRQNSSKLAQITADEVDVQVTGTGRTEAISVNGSNASDVVKLAITGDTKLEAHGSSYALGIYAAGNSQLDINGNYTVKAADGGWGITNAKNGALNEDGAFFNTSAIYAAGTAGSGNNADAAAVVNINGDVDLAVDGSGVIANMDGAIVNIKGGGTIKINDKPADFEGAAVHYALAAMSGTINMNVTNDTSKMVVLYGNVGVLDRADNDAESCKHSEVNLQLNTADSMWQGVAVEAISEMNRADGYTGAINLGLSNGATWYNQVYGNAYDEFEGSRVAS